MAWTVPPFAFVGNIIIGTTSWGERTLIQSGRFYPSSVRTSEQRLRFYARQFPLVEIDTTYYGIKSWRVAHDWARRTPRDFSFDVKAFRLFTQHRTPLNALPPELRGELGDAKNVYYEDVPASLRDELWRRFRHMLQPLAAANKLGVVLLQFPPWFIYGPKSLSHIEHCAEALEGFGVAVELRNKTWFSDKNRDRTLAFERSVGVVHVVADEPQESSFSIPAVWEATHPETAVVRLHGRNKDTWQTRSLPTAAERFDYLYSRKELEQLVEPLRALSREARRVHVLFNNCHADNAQRNAMSLQRLMETRADDVVMAASPA